MVDFAICLGGDGSLLFLNALFPTSVPPVIAFNLGSLGFVRVLGRLVLIILI